MTAAAIGTSTRTVRVSALVLLAAAVLLGLAGAGLASWAGEVSADIGAEAGLACNNAFQLPSWVYSAGWGGTIMTAVAVMMALVARAMVPRRAGGTLRDVLPALVAAPAVVVGVGFAVGDGPAKDAGVAVAALIVVVTVILHVATRQTAPRVPARRAFSWVVPAILTVTVLALLLALTGLDSVFLNAPNGLPVCSG